MPSQFAIGLKGGHEGLGGKWPVQRYEGYESKPNQSNRVCVYRRNNRVFRQCNNVACKSSTLSTRDNISNESAITGRRSWCLVCGSRHSSSKSVRDALNFDRIDWKASGVSD